ncbi:LysR family transcriptional regulator [Roseicyclus sp. F158]|uniref:LysR family transcriptional regulator n=1 Tax=Tropicimonas omnivorans TaxID=3075590 RepID=A0ABU3DMI1_9RHOB|nr:LysR family transcriptional regulator [Roseicyclus sp. F158]MDT0684312.1 LysR family transcriptional regulator [Roseicyclus sp. F158]
MPQLAHSLDLNRLRAFLAVAEEGSITLAAGRLGVAQPALSSSIKRLETDLGVALFERLPRGMSLTRYGRTLLPQVYDLFGRLAAMRDTLKDMETEPSGEVSIGLPPSASVVLTRPLLRVLTEEFPKVSLRLVEAMSGYLYDWVEAGELDMAITFNGLDTDTVLSRPMFREEMMLCGATDAMRDLPSPFPVERIAELPLIVTSARHTLRSNLQRQIEALGHTLNIRLEIDAGQQLVRMVSGGEGYGVFAPSAFVSELKAGQVQIVPLEPRYKRTVCLTYHRRKHADWVHEVIRARLEALIHELLGSGEWPAG